MKRSNLAWFSTLFIAIIAVALYVNRAAIYKGLDAAKLIPKPERFTELYFDDASFLPSETVAKVPISFSFIIHNLEGVTTTYPYSVYFKYPNGDKTIFETSSVTLSDNASTSIEETHTFKTSNLEGSVVVDLTDMDQQIDFLLSNPNQ